MSTRRSYVSFWWVLAGCLLAGTTIAATPPSSGGDALANDGNYPAARAAFTAAQKAAPNDASLMAKIADVDAQLGNDKSAVAWARRAVAAAPHTAKYQMLLGDALSNYVNDVSVFRKLSIAHAVHAAYQQAVQLAPHDADARTRLAMFYSIAPGIAGGSAAQADAQIAALAVDDPVKADLVRANRAYRNQQYAAAEALYRKAAASATDSAGDLALGNFLAQRKRAADALAVYRKTIAAFPHAPVAYYEIGKLASEGKAPAAEGARDLAKYLNLAINWENGDPTYDWAHYRLGLIAARGGDTAKAEAEYQAALRLDPAFKQARQALAKLRAT